LSRVGLMGGTFDPIHYGHLVTAEEAYVRFNLDKVIFIPSGNPPHKSAKKVTDGFDRFIMTQTVDTLKALKEDGLKDAELIFITGADAIIEICTWKNPRELFSLCRFAAATRPGYVISKDLVESVAQFGADRLDFFEVPALAISSTDIRCRIKEARPVRYLLPDEVISYIAKNGLYI
jgi:nicotinate-nucleotide adenylyltransferase